MLAPGPPALGEDFGDCLGGGGVVRGAAHGLRPAIGDFITIRIAGGGFLEEGKGARPIILADELIGLLEKLLGFGLGVNARFAFEGGGQGRGHLREPGEEDSFGGRRCGREDLARGFPAHFCVAPIFLRQLQPEMVVVEGFLNLVGARRNGFIEGAVIGRGWEEDQLMLDAQAADSTGRRAGRGRLMFFKEGKKFHDGQLLLGGLAQSNQLDKRRGSIVNVANVVEEFGLEENGFISGFVVLEELVQPGQGLAILVIVNQISNGAQGDGLLGGGPILGIQEVGQTRAEEERDIRGEDERHRRDEDEAGGSAGGVRQTACRHKMKKQDHQARNGDELERAQMTQFQWPGEIISDEQTQAGHQEIREDRVHRREDYLAEARRDKANNCLGGRARKRRRRLFQPRLRGRGSFSKSGGHFR